jgi:hypothetical protein
MYMEISIFGYKIELEILILICVLYLVMISHAACSCCNMPKLMDHIKKKKEAFTGKKDEKKEGFTGANTNFGQSSLYSLDNYNSVDPSKWGQPNLTYGPGMPKDKAIKDFENRPEQPVPLPEGELSMFATTPFKPECCPNTYSNSSGCACMTGKQFSYLTHRGGNNVPYSEY